VPCCLVAGKVSSRVYPTAAPELPEPCFGKMSLRALEAHF